MGLFLKGKNQDERPSCPFTELNLIEMYENVLRSGNPLSQKLQFERDPAVHVAAAPYTMQSRIKVQLGTLIIVKTS